eukprot:CAMPEP_0184869788 /NCGR_PEP_ID=MMETSP0580-20130426/35271_1 /TAXON_ID=1118495 /ORGANISM="Dactyliosolen fragilissimus" /LENGTH=590 /DNA_ID=CAMNT_0027371499 /DNA_START=8 /DNA_END=1780 /DNA_ORIENTATION=+
MSDEDKVTGKDVSDRSNIAARGKAGRTDYSEWSKKTSDLIASLESEEETEKTRANESLGLDGRHARSETEAAERAKAKEMTRAKKALDTYKERESGILEVLENVLPEEKNKNDDASKIRYVTRKDLRPGKRVLSVSNTCGPGTIVLTNDLSLLECKVATNAGHVPGVIPTNTPSTNPNDVNKITSNHNKGERAIHGIIKLNLHKLKDVTVIVRCRIITSTLDISHCENLTVKIEKEATIATIQADLCDKLHVEFRDAPSGKNIPRIHDGATTTFWGADKDDRIYHAGVKNMSIQIFRDGYMESETTADYIKDGAVAIGNTTAEEVQFVTSVVEDNLLTERVLRPGASTGTTVSGAMSGDDLSAGVGDNAGGAARPMTEREMKEIRNQREAAKAHMEQNSGIRILDKDGNEVKKKEKIHDSSEIVEEVYASMPNLDIDAIVKDCEAQKAKGNESFKGGEYAQAILLYTIALDRAAELPDANASKSSAYEKSLTQPFFARHIVLSNRSASFLKLGHHEKALEDAIKAERLDPTYVKGIFRKGLALHAMGRYDEAITALAAALKIEPKNKQIKQALQFAEIRFQQLMQKRMNG